MDDRVIRVVRDDDINYVERFLHNMDELLDLFAQWIGYLERHKDFRVHGYIFIDNETGDKMLHVTRKGNIIFLD